jgi:hypothetical protein
MANKIEKIRESMPVIVVGALAEAFNKSFSTIYRWISTNDDRLTSDKAKKVFVEHGFEWIPKEDSEREVLAADAK